MQIFHSCIENYYCTMIIQVEDRDGVAATNKTSEKNKHLTHDEYI